MKEIITRQQIKDLLIQWRGGELTEAQLHKWAESKYQNDNVEYTDWENDNSVSNEVLAALDMMDMNLMTKEDIKYYLEFLETPSGNFDEGIKKLGNNLKTVELLQRKKALAANPFYENFCK